MSTPKGRNLAALLPRGPLIQQEGEGSPHHHLHDYADNGHGPLCPVLVTAKAKGQGVGGTPQSRLGTTPRDPAVRKYLPGGKSA